MNGGTACIVIIFMENIDEESSKRIHPQIMRIGSMGEGCSQMLNCSGHVRD